MKSLALGLSFTFIGSMAFAGDANLNEVRAKLPANTDVAQVAIATLRGDDAAAIEAILQANVLERDFDGNGINDLMVLVEKEPKLAVNFDENEPCYKFDYQTGCLPIPGARSLLVYMNGANTPAFSNEKFILAADEGGIFGDPLNGFTVNSKGSVQVNFYGGSAWRWGFQYTLQFRKDNFYLIGLKSDSGWNGDGRFDSVDTNFLTGNVVKQSQKNFEAPVKTVRSKIKTKPLVKLEDIENANQ